MRALVLVVLFATPSSGCITPETHEWWETHIEGRGSDCVRNPMPFSEFEAGARADLVSMETRYDNVTKTMGIANHPDVVREALRVLFAAYVNQKEIMEPPSTNETIRNNEYVGLEFRDENGTWLPNMYDGCGQSSGVLLFILFGNDVIMSCGSDLYCGNKGTHRDLGALHDLGETAHYNP